MAQGESEEGDATVQVNDFSFHVEREIAEVINFFEIDYVNGWLRKGFAIYPNGRKESC